MDWPTLLETYRVETLRRMVHRRSLPVGERARRAELVRCLSRSLSDPAAARRVLIDLGADHRYVLDHLRSVGGRVDRADLVEEMKGRIAAVDQAVEDLVATGLIFLRSRSPGHQGPEARGRLIMNPAVLPVLEDRLPPSTPDLPPAARPRAGSVRPSHPADLLMDAFLLLDRLERTEIRLLSSGQPSRRLLKILDRKGTGPAPPVVFALLEEGGLIRVQRGILCRGARAERFLRAGPVAQLGHLLQAWLDTPRGGDRIPAAEVLKTRVDTARGRASPPQARTQRRTLARTLGTLAPGTWHHLHHLVKQLTGRDPGQERSITRHLVTGPLHHLGLVDLAGSTGRGERFRLTELGAHLLGQAPPPSIPPAPRPLRVQPTFEVIMEGAGLAVDLALAADLARFAHPTRGDRTLVFHIERDLVMAALQEGWSVDRMVDCLQEASNRSLAQNVEVSLRHWAESSRRLTIHRRVTLLEIEPHLLQRLARRRSVAEAIHTPLAPGLYLLGPSGPAPIRRILNNREIPVTRVDHREGPGCRLRVDGEGRIRVVGGRPDPVTIGWLIRIARRARPNEKADWRLNRTKLASALRTGLDLDRVMRVLEERTDDLPDALRKRLLAWAGEDPPKTFA